MSSHQVVTQEDTKPTHKNRFGSQPIPRQEQSQEP